MKAFAISLLFVLAGCCAPASSPCGIGGPYPCGTATYLHPDGNYEHYKVYPRGVYVEVPKAKAN